MSLYIALLSSAIVLVDAYIAQPTRLAATTLEFYPHEHISAEILNNQIVRFGLSKNVRCSSLMGPACASSTAMNVNEASSLIDDVDINTFIEFDSAQTNTENHWSSGDGLPLDVIIVSQLGLGRSMTEEELEDARYSFEDVDPVLLADAADKVAEAIGIDDKSRFRHKFLSAFASLLTEETQDENSDDEDDDYEYIDDFFIYPSKADQELSWKERREEARLDRITKRIKDTMADVLPVQQYIDREERDGDMHKQT